MVWGGLVKKPGKEVHLGSKDSCMIRGLFDFYFFLIGINQIGAQNLTGGQNARHLGILAPCLPLATDWRCLTVTWLVR